MVLEGKRIELLLTLFFPPGVGGHPQEFQVADARDFNGVLKSEEHPQTGTLFRLQLKQILAAITNACLLYTSPSPRDATLSRMPSSA